LRKSRSSASTIDLLIWRMQSKSPARRDGR
jgi:hypothetical protein